MAALVTALDWRDHFIIEVAEEGFDCVVPFVDDLREFADAVNACVSIHNLRQLVVLLGKKWIVDEDGFSWVAGSQHPVPSAANIHDHDVALVQLSFDVTVCNKSLEKKA